MTERKIIHSFREMPADAWGFEPPDMEVADRVLAMFCKEDQEQFTGGGYKDGRCWYTTNYHFDRHFQGCHSQLGYDQKNNPAWRESLDTAYVCRNPKNEEIIGWIWPNMKIVPALQTTHFCISTRDLTEHSFILNRFMTYLEGDDLAEGDPRLAWMLAQYFQGETNELSPNPNTHSAFEPNLDGKIPKSYITGPAKETEDPTKNWTLRVNRFYQVWDTKKNDTVSEFISRYKQLVANAEKKQLKLEAQIGDEE